MTLTTSWPTPFALVARNGVSPGKRPNTKMAFITRAVAEKGQIIGYKGRIATSDEMIDFSSTVREIEVDEVIATWRSRPALKTIQRERAKLRPVPREHCWPLPQAQAIAIVDGEPMHVVLCHVAYLGPRVGWFRASPYGGGPGFYVDPAAVKFRWDQSDLIDTVDRENVNAARRAFGLPEMRLT